MKSLIKNTKIVSTFGPSITFDLDLSQGRDKPEIQPTIAKVKTIIRDLFLEGVNCVRFNFSHGLVDENNTRIAMINEVQRDFVEAQANKERKFLRPHVLLADTKGPEIRVFDMGSKQGVEYKLGQEVIVSCVDRKVGSPEGFSVIDATGTYNMANDCIVGNSILLEDGKLTLEILEVDKEKGLVKTRVKNTYTLKTNKRINLPGADYSMDFLSEKDKTDIKYAIDNGFEYVALSFVNSAKDVQSVRDLIDNYCKEKNIPNIMKVYSKIETFKSCENIDSIIDASDGIMIARGDLGLEIPYYEVPYWTKQIIRKCRQKQKPAITATQMLDSLERGVVATRAEVSDVYRAAEMGSDCTMLSGETAQGAFPVLAVKTMTNIVFESEKRFNNEKFFNFFKENTLSKLSQKTQDECLALEKAYCSKCECGVSALAVKYEDVSKEFLLAVSEMRLSAPVFVFVSVSDVSTYCKKVDWNDKDYIKMKEAAGLALYRGISLVFCSNSQSLPVSQLFSEFMNASAEDCCVCSQKPCKVLYFENGNWSN